MSKPRTALQRVCAYPPCRQSFWVQRARAASGRGLFCSKDCWRLQQVAQHTLCICQYAPCGKIFTIPPNVRDNGRGTFCSRTCANLAMRRGDVATRLWAQIARCGHEEACLYCCWPWQGTRWKTGYGRLTLDEVAHTTSRLIWEVWNKRSMPSDLEAAHYCNYPPCNNPLHIYPATPSQNAHDAIRAGTRAYGSRHHMSKLTESDIPVIFALRAAGQETKTLANQYAVSVSTIRMLLRRRTWRHVALE